LAVLVGVVAILAAWMLDVPVLARFVDIVLLLLLGLAVLALLAAIVLSLPLGAFASGASLLPLPKVPLSYNLRNLSTRWITTLIIVGAFAVVVFLVTGMLAFALGMSRLTENSGQPANVVILEDGATDEAFSRLPAGVGVGSLPRDIQMKI